MTYTHLSREERYQIHALNRLFPCRQIAEQLGRSPSTIAREIARNKGREGYDAKQAHGRSLHRRHAASSRPRISLSDWRVIEDRLREQWSPEQIAGSGEIAVSHERIYQYIADDRRGGGTLWKQLRRRKRRRHRCGTSRERQRFGGRRIGKRPAIVETRRRVGDWEGDTIVGPGVARIVTLVERKTGLVRLRRVASGQAMPTLKAIVHALHPLRARVRTLTLDNGSEFAEHELMDLALDAKTYFADPFASWQRGSNENLNGLLRQYLPKGCDLGRITDQELQHIEDRLNRRPRKRLGYRTPQTEFEASFNRVALRS